MKKSIASHRVAKPNKVRAMQIIRKLYSGETCDNEILLAQLYQYFIPSLPARPKTLEQWVAKAMAGNKDPRFHLGYVYSDGINIVGCDGRRLHMVRSDKYENGSYDKAMTRVDADVADTSRYPPYLRVIPRTNGRVSLKLSELHRTVATSPAGIICYELRHVMHDPILSTVDKKYLDDALSFLDDPVFYFGERTDSVLIIEGPCTVVIHTLKMQPVSKV